MIKRTVILLFLSISCKGAGLVNGTLSPVSGGTGGGLVPSSGTNNGGNIISVSSVLQTNSPILNLSSSSSYRGTYLLNNFTNTALLWYFPFIFQMTNGLIEETATLWSNLTFAHALMYYTTGQDLESLSTNTWSILLPTNTEYGDIGRMQLQEGGEQYFIWYAMSGAGFELSGGTYNIGWAQDGHTITRNPGNPIVSTTPTSWREATLYPGPLFHNPANGWWITYPVGQESFVWPLTNTPQPVFETCGLCISSNGPGGPYVDFTGQALALGPTNGVSGTFGNCGQNELLSYTRIPNGNWLFLGRVAFSNESPTLRLYTIQTPDGITFLTNTFRVITLTNDAIANGDAYTTLVDGAQWYNDGNELNIISDNAGGNNSGISKFYISTPDSMIRENNNPIYPTQIQANGYRVGVNLATGNNTLSSSQGYMDSSGTFQGLLMTGVNNGVVLYENQHVILMMGDGPDTLSPGGIFPYGGTGGNFYGHNNTYDIGQPGDAWQEVASYGFTTQGTNGGKITATGWTNTTGSNCVVCAFGTTSITVNDCNGNPWATNTGISTGEFISVQAGGSITASSGLSGTWHTQ